MSAPPSWRAWVLAACALFGACRKEAPESAAPADRGWEVLKEGRVVLLIKDEPGPIVSTAAPPPGSEPVLHPFLTASALDPMEEDALRRLLDKAKSFDEFVSLLKAAGYAVRPASGP